MTIVIDQTPIDRVLSALQQQGRRYPLEEVVGLCPGLSWGSSVSGDRLLNPNRSGMSVVGYR